MIFGLVLGRARTVESPPVVPPSPPPLTPRAKRDDLRKQVKAKGGEIADIESITGDCPDQIDKQTRNLTAWLSQH